MLAYVIIMDFDTSIFRSFTLMPPRSESLPALDPPDEEDSRQRLNIQLLLGTQLVIVCHRCFEKVHGYLLPIQPHFIIV